MISNTLAIQKGRDPTTASIEFHWKTDGNGQPEAFFPDRDGDRFWPGHGIVLRDRLILFLMRVRGTPAGLGFEVYDWDAVMVMNPGASPSQWKLRWLTRPANAMQIIVGSASVIRSNDHVYAFSSREPAGGDAYLVRWSEGSLYDGDLSAVKWWSTGGLWTSTDDPDHEPAPVLHRAGTEFTVHRDPKSGLFLQVQCTGFGAADVEIRTASNITGPWSEPLHIYRPPEHARLGVMIYQGKAHPQLQGADLIVTYSTNCFDFDEMVNDQEIYFPRFVRLRLVQPTADGAADRD